MAVNPNLWTEIERALDASEYYILLASPAAAASYWVRKEADRWVQTKPNDHLLLALTEGSIVWDHSKGDFDWDQTSALPPTLRGAFKDQPPLWLDLRWAREATELSLPDPRFTDAVVSLAAPIHGRRKDELAGEEVREHRRTVRLARAAAAALATLTVAAVVAGVIALVQSGHAIANQHVAESRALAGEAISTLDTNPGMGALLALEAYRSSPSLEARGAILSALEHFRDGILPAGSEPVKGVALSPDGRTLASGGLDGKLRLWDYASGRLRATIGAPGPVETVAFSPDGRVLAWGGLRGNLSTAIAGYLAIRSVSSGATTVLSFTNRVSSLSFSGNGNLLAAGTYGGQVMLLDPTTDRPLKQLGTNFDQVLGVALDRQGRALAAVGSANAGQPIDLWRLDRGGPPLTFGQRGVFEYSVAFNPTGTMLATGDNHGNLDLWNPKTATTTGPPLGASDEIINGLAFSADGSLVATASSDRTIRLWSVAAHRQLGDPLAGHTGSVNSVAIGPNDELVSGSADQTVREWDPRRFSPSGYSTVGQPIAGFQSVKRVAFSGNGQVLAVAAGQVAIFDGRSLTLRYVLRSPTAGVAVSPDGTEIATGVQGGIALLNAHSARLIQLLVSSNASGSSPASFTPSGTALLAQGGGSGESLWQLAGASSTPNCSYCVSGRDFTSDQSSAVALSPDGRTLAVGNQDGSVQILAAPSYRQVLLSPPRTGGQINSVAFDPTRPLLAVAGQDNLIHLWDLGRRRELRTFSGHNDVVEAVAFTADGSTLASASDDRTLRLWDVASGRQLGPAVPLDAEAAAVPATLNTIALHPSLAPVINHMDISVDNAGSLVVGADAGGPPLVLPAVLTGHSLASFERYLCPVVREDVATSIGRAAGLCADGPVASIGQSVAPASSRQAGVIECLEGGTCPGPRTAVPSPAASPPVPAPKARLIAQADRICQGARNALTPIQTRATADQTSVQQAGATATPVARAQVARDFEQFAAVYHDEAGALKHLTPPRSDLTTVDRYIALISQQGDLLGAIAAAYVPAPRGAQLASLEAQENQARTQGQLIARQYGFHVCGSAS